MAAPNVGVGGGGEVEVDEVEIAKFKTQTAKYKVYDFSLKAKYRPPDRPPKQSSNSSLIYHFESRLFNPDQCIDAIIPTRLIRHEIRYDARSTLNGAPS